MRFGLRDFDWDSVGALLARADSREQAEFFRAFVKECLTWGTRLQVEKQLGYVNQNLSKEEKETLSMLGLIGEGEKNEGNA
jgi:hypothetical protein